MTYVRTIVAVFVSVQLGVFVPLFPVLAQAQQVSSTTPSQEQAVQIDEVVSSPEPEIAEEQPADTDETEVIIPTVEEEELEITDETSSSTPTQEINASTTTPTEETDVREDIDTSTTLDPVVIENNDDEVTSSQRIGYVRMMRDLRSSRLSDTVSAPEVLDQFTSFLKSEKDRVSELPISRSNRNAYLQRLEGQFKAVDTSEKSRFENVWTKMKEFFGIEEPPLRFDEETEADIPNVQRLEEPAEFAFQPDDVEVTGLHAVEVPGSQDIDEAIKTFLTIKEANADNTYFPVLEDLSGDSSEIVFTPSMRSLARELHNNPVEIYNFVRQRITYEPYFGAKKGSVGCLEEMRCNDVDAASLTLALMRAAGIPGHYKKSIMVVSIDQLQEMFGLDHTTEAKRTVYGIFGWNDVPVYSISNNPSLGNLLDEADFTDETHFALEWVFPEIYYEYDERGANIDNFVDLSVASSTAELQEFFQETYKKQWIPIDVLVKDYTRIENEIVSDTANFNTQDFWYAFYQYQGDLSPMAKYAADLQSATGKDITSDVFHSYRESSDKTFDILPPRLPYVLGEGVDGYGNEILPETWSVLPDARKQSVVFQLKKQDTGDVVFETSLFGSDLRNKEFNLYYEGMTEDDTAIIDSYGGIHATPAELVDIHPALQTDDAEYAGDIPVSIGEALVMRFDYYVNGELEHSDEKFSVAGNQEGIFITLSRVQADPELTDNSLILLKGNTAIAREYLLRGQESNDLLAKSLDHSYNVNFARAVVTQNRVLSTVNGSPTTFDFKGFTIDAGTYINNWSNTGNYKTHRTDFRLLWGLESSYQEGQIFKDITGLSSISTVQGLQYAYAHPESYTMHIITTANEAVIDTLALSANTKANMHADVQAGSTILTADKFVQKGVWNGILYTSIEPQGTGTYAIGEQSQSNGGATTEALLAGWYALDGKEINFQELFLDLLSVPYHFSYEDRPGSTSGIACLIDRATFDSIQNAPDWNSFYGQPCIKATKDFSTVSHTFIVATNAAKFYSPNAYNYWTYYASARNILSTAVGNSFKNEKFKFNIIAGTYSYYNGSTYYYEPVGGSVGGRAHKVSGAILSKLQDKGYSVKNCTAANTSEHCTWILSRIGFPVQDQSGAAESFSGANGYYQKFVGGDVYVKTDWLWFDEVYYVPEQIRKMYNSYESSINGNYGTGGKFGFPLEDPAYFFDTNELLQKFEWKMINHSYDSHINNTVEYSDNERRLNSKKYGEVILNNVKNGDKSDIEAFRDVSNYISYIAKNNEEFVRDMTVFFVGTESIAKSELTKALNHTVEYEKSSDPQSTYRVLGFSDTGFSFKYNDSHYCMDPKKQCISNQLYHSMAGMALSFFYGDGAGILGTIFHDWNTNPLGVEGDSIEDRNLGYAMSDIGNQLRIVALTKEDVGARIFNKLSDNQYAFLRESQDSIIANSTYRKKFRIMEYQLNQNVFGKWGYSQDMKVYNCNGNNLFYQDYSYIYHNGENVGDAKAIWNKQQSKMILAYKGLKDSYRNDIKLFCVDIDELTNNFGFSLTKTFEQIK